MAEEIKKRGRGGKYNFPNTIDPDSIEQGTNARFIRHALVGMNLPPIDISDEKQVEERIFWYFNHCIEDDMKPTVNGLCNSLGVSRDTIWQWKNGNYRGATHSDVIKKAYGFLEEMWESYMLNGKINPVSGIFLGKNMFGYRDQQDVVVSPRTSDYQDPATIEQKYAELPSPTMEVIEASNYGKN